MARQHARRYKQADGYSGADRRKRQNGSVVAGTDPHAGKKRAQHRDETKQARGRSGFFGKGRERAGLGAGKIDAMGGAVQAIEQGYMQEQIAASAYRYQQDIETREKITAEAVRALLGNADGVTVVDERVNGGYPTAVTESAGNDNVFVGRIREDISHSNGIDLWVVGDNVRKGAALNSVQIAEVLVKKYI